MQYEDFIKTKLTTEIPTGIKNPKPINPKLFNYQQDIVTWALKRGRAAIFSACGTGKSAMQLEWAKHVYEHTRRDVLILAPLAVTQQTIEEGAKFDIEVNSARKQSDIKPGLNITNYEMLHNFDCSHFGGVVLDESSILKSYTGKYRNDIIEGFARTAFKLACTATPSPNDFMELGNHTEFLGIMSRVGMLATYFVHDGGETSKWRLKGHAASEFWKWMATWCVMVEKPSDLGYSDEGFILPPLNHHQIVVKSPPSPGALFAFEAKTLTERRQARKDSLKQRVNAAVELVKQAPDDNWLIWCDLNIESEMLTKAIPGAVEVKGSDKPEIKEKNLLGFGKDFKILTSKPKIAAFGMNYQHTNKMIFVGLSDSFEAYYQAVRRCWRFGQTKPVDVYVITSEAEGAVVKNIEEKESKANQMIEEIIKNMKDEMNREVHNAVIKQADDYKTGHNKGETWELYMGDCVDGVKQLPDNSIHYSIFSPPFASLYTYSNSARDMGNCSGDQEFYDHFKFLVSELHRVIKPGRLVSFHCMNLPTSKQNHGFIGIRDFRGELIRMFEDVGFIYHSEVCIWKDPVIAMQRTKALGLLHKQLKKDSAMSRQGIPDYLVTMRKHGDNPEPVSHTAEDFPVHVWQQYASPIWMDINPSDTLQYRSAREHKDEKHICIAEGSLVLTKQGYIPIESVNVGDEVLTHLGRWKPVTAKICNGVHDVIHVKAQGVPNLVCTPTHKLYVKPIKGSHEKQYAMKADPQWMHASETIGAYLNLKLPPVEETTLTNLECWIIGRWLGDGHRGVKRTKHAPIVISCGKHEEEYLIKKLGIHAGTKQYLTAVQILIKKLRNEVKEIIGKCGHGAENKKIPNELLSLPTEQATHFLDGYFSADGHYVKKHDRQTASSVSRPLLLGIAIISQRVHESVVSVYAGRKPRKQIIQGREVNTRQDWVLAYRKSDGYKKSGWIDSGGSWKKVRSIEPVGKKTVWDLQVQDDESFTVEGSIVHNCPLQLEVIRRALKLWTNPGDLVLTPFAGIGSELVVSLEEGRRAVGFELKESYYKQAVKNCQRAEKDKGQQLDLFGMAVTADA